MSPIITALFVNIITFGPPWLKQTVD